MPLTSGNEMSRKTGSHLLEKKKEETLQNSEILGLYILHFQRATPV